MSKEPEPGEYKAAPAKGTQAAVKITDDNRPILVLRQSDVKLVKHKEAPLLPAVPQYSAYVYRIDLFQRVSDSGMGEDENTPAKNNPEMYPSLRLWPARMEEASVWMKWAVASNYCIAIIPADSCLYRSKGDFNSAVQMVLDTLGVNLLATHGVGGRVPPPVG